MSGVTRLPEAIRHGDARAGYGFLSSIRNSANAPPTWMAREQSGHTSQPPMLVYEAGRLSAARSFESREF